MLDVLTMCASGRSSSSGRNALVMYSVPRQLTFEDSVDRRVVEIVEPHERLDDAGVVDDAVDLAEAFDHLLRAAPPTAALSVMLTT